MKYWLELLVSDGIVTLLIANSSDGAGVFLERKEPCSATCLCTRINQVEILCGWRPCRFQIFEHTLINAFSLRFFVFGLGKPSPACSVILSCGTLIRTIIITAQWLWWPFQCCFQHVATASIANFRQ